MEDASPRVSPGRLAGAACYIGIAGYGGGPAIIAYTHQYFVLRKGWVSEHDFQLGLSLSQVLPGAQALSVITFLGYRLGGAWGALVASACFLAPATLLMIALSALYFAFGQLPIVQVLFKGLGAVVVALLVNATWSMGRTALKDRRGMVIALAAFLTLLWLHTAVLVVIVAAAGVGALLYPRQPLPLTEDETTGNPARGKALWGWGLVVLVVLGALLYITWESTATQLFLAMLRVGVFTFGGGYASVPLLQHEVVTHQWLTIRQFLDGIALGQVTPGPVLITGTFIGYHVLGVWGAVLGTLAIFAPGGIAMFFLTRQHHRIRQLRWLWAMVRGVVAAFIGVLLFVTIQLAGQSLTDWKTVVLAAIGIVALMIWRRDPLWVILATLLASPFLFHQPR